MSRYHSAWLSAAAVAVLGLTACGDRSAPAEPAADDAAAPADQADNTLSDRMQPLCDQAFAGRVAINEPTDPDPAYQQSPVLGVRCVGPYKILAISFGDDRSRSIILSKDRAGVQGLRHLHNNPDGSARELTEYGGYANQVQSSPERVVFPATHESVVKFQNLGLDSRADSVWTLAMEESARLVYDAKATGWHLQLVFDLQTPVPAPSLPWVEAPVE